MYTTRVMVDRAARLLNCAVRAYAPNPARCRDNVVGERLVGGGTERWWIVGVCLQAHCFVSLRVSSCGALNATTGERPHSSVSVPGIVPAPTPLTVSDCLGSGGVAPRKLVRYGNQKMMHSA